MFRVGVDVGGTFTDLFAWDMDTGEVRTAKAHTTRSDLPRGVLDALHQAAIEPAEIETFVHGSTTATNALIERKFPEPALITTEGFRDTIEIGRQHRRHLYDPYQQKPRPLVRRRHRFTVPEKMRATGRASRPLDEGAARDVARRIRELGFENVAIAFINSWANRSHEDRMREILVDEVPDAHVGLSADIPKFRELGRFITTVVRAALLPVIGDYLQRLEGELQSRGFVGVFYVIKSNGGVVTASVAKSHPEELIESGPAGGVAAAGVLSDLMGNSKLIATDMGGTSFDVCLVEDAQGLVRDDYEIEWDMPIVTPMLDIRSIGAGGGSIAWVDEGGSLRVGPQSAGSDPGPACYGEGGVQPTVTDANLLLGRLDSTLGGKLQLDEGAARTAVASVAETLGLGVLECAEGIIKICAENMASAIKIVTIDRGRDPRDYALVSFGGAGAMHAWAIAPSVGIEKIIVPPFAGVASAFGATMMDVRHDIEATFYMPCADAELERLNDKYSELEAEGISRLKSEGFGQNDVEVVRSAGMRYVGQSYEVNTPVRSGHLDADALAGIQQEFNHVHEREHGVYSNEFPIAFVNLRITAVGKTRKPDIRAHFVDGSRASNGQATTAKRDVYFDGEFVETPVYTGTILATDTKLDGPAIIEYQDSEIIVPPGMTFETDASRNVILSVA